MVSAGQQRADEPLPMQGARPTRCGASLMTAAQSRAIHVAMLNTAPHRALRAGLATGPGLVRSAIRATTEAGRGPSTPSAGLVVHPSRRALLRGLATVPALATPLGRAALAQEAPPQPLPTVEVAPGIHVAHGQHALMTPANAGMISNSVIIVGEQGVAVVDSFGSAGAGRRLAATVARLTPLPVRYLVNTHMHPDHVFGNASLVGPETTVVGHAKLARALAARGERYLTANGPDLAPTDFRGTQVVLPTRLVETSLTLDLGNRPLTLTAMKTAHTDNDLVVRDEKTATLILGDLLFAGHVPALDGSLKGWIAALNLLKTWPAERAVPGHGPASMPWPGALDDELRYLTTLAIDVRAAIKAGRTLEDAMATAGVSERTAWFLFDAFHKRNVAAAYAELEWE